MAQDPNQNLIPDEHAIWNACIPTPIGDGWALKIATVARFVLPHLEALDSDVRSSIMAAVCAVFVEHGGAIRSEDSGAEGEAVFLDAAADEDAVTAAMIACSEATALLRDAPHPEWGSSLVLELRAGVATGRVIVDTDGNPAPEVHNLATVVARKLARAAGPDEVLVDEATIRAATRTLHFAEVDPLRVGTLALPAWRLDTKALPRRVHTGRLLSQRAQTALVGRDRELATVHELFDSCVDEQRLHRVAIVAQRGSGRGRFIDEAMRRVQAAWPEVASTRVTIRSREEFAVPFELRRQLVASMVAASPTTAMEPEQQFTELLDILAPFEPALEDRFVRDRLEVVAGQAGPQDDGAIDPEHASEATYAAVAALMRGAAGRGGLIMGIHGLSQAREDHRRQLLRLLDGLRGYPVLVLFATSSGREPGPEWALEDIQDRRVELAPLTMQSGTHLLDQLLGRPDALNSETASALVTRTGGLPVVLEQMLAALGDMGQLHPDPESGHWSIGSPDALNDLPCTPEALFEWRIDRLSNEEQSALRHAATVGPEFWRSLIADLGTPRVAAVFRRLEDHGFIQQLAGDTLAGEQAYGFTHPALRPLLLARCDETESSETHGRTARWLSTHAHNEDMRWTGAIAWHFAQAGDPDQSASYDRLAGRWARSIGDLGLAIDHFQRANREATSRDLQMESLLAQGEALQLARRHAEAQPLLDDALQWAEEQGEPPVVLRCLLAQAHAADTALSHSTVEALLERALPMAETLQDEHAHTNLLLNLARMQLGKGKHDLAHETLETAFPLAAAANDRLTTARLTLQRGRLLMHMGRLAEARETLDAAADAALALHHEVLYELAREGKGWVALAQGEVEEGAALFTDGARVFGRLGSQRPALRCALGLAHVEASRGNFTEGANQAAEALEQATDNGEPVMEAWALSSIAWIFGEVRRGKHKLKAKELTPASIKVAKIDLGEHLQRAMAALDEIGGGPGLYRGHAALALAEHLADQGDDAASDALAVAKRAVQGFESGRLRIRLEQLVARVQG